MNRRQLLRGFAVGVTSSISGCLGVITNDQLSELPLTRIETTNVTGGETDIQVEITSLSGELVSTHSETLAGRNSDGTVNFSCINKDDGLDIKNVFDYNYKFTVNNEREGKITSKHLSDKYKRQGNPDDIIQTNLILIIHEERLVIAADLKREPEENPCGGN